MALTFNRSFQVNLATNMTTFLGFGSDAAGLHVFEYGGNSDLIWIYPFTGGDPSVDTSISVGTGSSWSGLARSPDGYASLINRTILERDSAGASVSSENDGRTDRQLGVTWDSTDTRWLTLARDNTDLRVMSYPSLGDLDEAGQFWDIDTITDTSQDVGSLARVGDEYYALYGSAGREAKIYDTSFAETGGTLDLSTIPADVDIVDFTSYDSELFVLASDGMVYVFAGETVVAPVIDVPVQIYGLQRFRRKYDILRGLEGESATYIADQIEMLQYTVGASTQRTVFTGLGRTQLVIASPDLDVNFIPVSPDLDFSTGDWIVIRPGEDRLGKVPQVLSVAGRPEVDGVEVFTWKITGFFLTGGPPTEVLVIRASRE